MNQLSKINLVVMQPAGYVHSLVFIDTARYFRYHFRRAGAAVSISKNRVRADSMNIVFGAHLGFPEEWCSRYSVAFVNLEQLGPTGAECPADYLRLLQNNPVIDYHAGNAQAYRPGAACKQHLLALMEFAQAPYLKPQNLIALRDRPIDLLFIGSMNEARQRQIERIRDCGVDVAVFDQAIYGPERDLFIQQSKAVLNLPFYEAGIFEQVRAFGVLSLGTPLVSLRRQAPPASFEDAVCWVDDDTLEAYFKYEFGSEPWLDQVQAKLLRWHSGQGDGQFAPVIELSEAVWQQRAAQCLLQPWAPTRINLGSGKDYLPGFLNLDVLDRTEPDLLLDLSQPIDLPAAVHTRDGTPVLIREGHYELIYANNVLEHVHDLPTLMGNALRLLQDGGRFLIEVPYERAPTAWQDPTHLRALNENSWLYYTDWFWYLGWFENRFELANLTWLNLALEPCSKEEAAFMRVELVKSSTTLSERMTARTMQPDFGGLPTDELELN